MTICKICNNEYNSLQSLSKHICVHNISPKKYYDLYLKTSNDGICICGKETAFLSLSRGYRKTCSHKCHAILQNSTYTNEQINVINSKRKETWSKKDLSNYSDLQHIIQKERWSTITESERLNFSKKVKEALAKDEIKQKLGKQQSISMKIYMNNLSDEEKLIRKDKISKAVKKWYKENPDKVLVMNINRKNAFNNLTKEAKELSNQKRINTFANKSKEEKLKSYEIGIKTKRIKGTLNVSKQEKDVENQLKLKFSNIYTQYKSKQYPWFCDFYIPELDLYIECHFHWTHGKHPYNKKLDQSEAQLWKSKNSKYYKIAYYVWTYLDVKKLNTAKKNNLNYLCFYSIKEFNNWFERL